MTSASAVAFTFTAVVAAVRPSATMAAAFVAAVGSPSPVAAAVVAVAVVVAVGLRVEFSVHLAFQSTAASSHLCVRSNQKI